MLDKTVMELLPLVFLSSASYWEEKMYLEIQSVCMRVPIVCIKYVRCRDM